MKKKWKAITAVLMALLILATAAVPAVAETENDDGSVNQSVVKSLGIDAPRRALVGNEITITVFERGTQKPVSGASVWAISPDKISEFQSAVAEIDTESTADQDYETTCNLYGEFLGKTTGHGELNHTFDETGRYLLVATKNHYYPGFSHITVYAKPKALGIRAPRVAHVNTDVIMTVFDRFTNDPVQGAGVWAFSRESAEALKGEMANIRAVIKDSAMDYDYESLMNIYGEFLGRTNDEGQLTHEFDEIGKYILVTWKPGYWPGFAQIAIRDEIKSLIIRAPRVAHAGDEVTMTVYEKPSQPDLLVNPIPTSDAVELSPSLMTPPTTNQKSSLMISGLTPKPAIALEPKQVNNAQLKPVSTVPEIVLNPVSGAGIWAFSQENAEILKKEIEAITSANTTDADYESLMNIYGEFLGRTNDQGQLKHTFDEIDEYVLVTWKPGYLPGFSSITIKAKRPALAIRAPHVTFVDKEVTMTVYERPGSLEADVAPNTVEGAGIWALSIENAEALKKEIELIAETDEVAALERDYESMMGFYGEFLGFTDENGQLRHTFNDTGKYVLVTWKQGYWPGYARLTVRELPQALGIKAPRVAQVDEDVTMKVFQRGTGDPVGGADMWAFSWDQTDSLKESMSDIRSLDSSVLDYESISSNAGGIYLGQTNNSGELTHAFNDTGKYLLLTFKDGYWPGFRWIKITELQPGETLPSNEFIIE